MATSDIINSTISSGRAWLESQLEQTERLRPLLAVTALVLFFGLLISAIAASSNGVRSLHAAQTELAKLQQQLKDGSWAERKQQSETLRFNLLDRFWTAETAGLAEASLERWLRERIEKLGVRPDTIRVQRSALSSNPESAKKSPLGSAQRMTAKIIMPFEPEALMQLLNAAATNDKILIVDRLLIRGGRNALIEMDVSTFVTLPEGAK